MGRKNGYSGLYGTSRPYLNTGGSGIDPDLRNKTKIRIDMGTRWWEWGQRLSIHYFHFSSDVSLPVRHHLTVTVQLRTFLMQNREIISDSLQHYRVPSHQRDGQPRALVFWYKEHLTSKLPVVKPAGESIYWR